MPSYRLPGAARLKRRELIRPLFDRSRKDVLTVAHGCVRLVFRLVSRSEAQLQVPVQVGFSPGRGVRRAVDRNEIKRHMRETYRLHQGLVVGAIQSDLGLTMMVLFRGRLDAVKQCVRRDLPIALEKAVRQIAEQASTRPAPTSQQTTE